MPHEVKTLEVLVYLHNDLVSTAPTDGVEVAAVQVTIGRRIDGRHYGRWHIDAVDWDGVKGFMPRSKSSKAPWASEGKRLVFRLCVRAAIRAGLDPADVRGWGRYFKPPNGSMAQIMWEEREAAGL